MLIGLPKEIKNNEFRVGLTPSSVHELHNAGHQIKVETNAGIGCGFQDSDFVLAGAEIVEHASDIFESSDLIIKVKEPQAIERAQLRPAQTLFTYLHLAPDIPQTNDLLASGATCIAYETVTDNSGRLPLLAPMSEVAGRMSIQAGARCLEKSQKGSGILLGGVPGVLPANVLILGAGVVGSNATQMAVGLGANVTVMDKSLDALRHLNTIYGSKIKTLFSTQQTLAEQLLTADLVIGAVLIPGAAAPKLVTRKLLKTMKQGSAIVDVAIDQGGCFETSHPTTHDQPIFVEEGVVHYCVANMPGALARTATQALNNATLPYVLELANKGIKRALSENPGLLQGLNIVGGKLTSSSVASAQQIMAISLESGLQIL
jgi:alanine dehydrogenase